MQSVRKNINKLSVNFPGLIVVAFFCFSLNCCAQYRNEDVVTGAERLDLYLPLLEQKRVGLVANHTSIVNGSHLLDTLLSLNVSVVKIFSPEHGFRGIMDAGEAVVNAIDKETGIPVISLYGDNKEPKQEQMQGIDIMVFDMQDVGVRFYTYISTLTLVMKACAASSIDLIVLDRPNPNGHYVDGPVLEARFKSFVGMHEVPVVYGMTIGEYALMVKGEAYNSTGTCRLRVIPLENYDHTTLYRLPVKPSPNLPNMRSVYLYPSLCFFEGTVVSIGRGTPYPFQVVGHPDFALSSFVFTPESTAGSKNPVLMGRSCSGYNLSDIPENEISALSRLNLSYLLEFYQALPDKKAFFNTYFNLLAGNSTLRQQITEGKKEDEIRQSWAFDIDRFMKIREKYLLYPDFEKRLDVR